MSPIVWSVVSDPADGMVATPDVIIVVGEESITAFDRTTGQVRWSNTMSDTSGPTPVVVTPAGLVVVLPPYENVQAFDVATGKEAAVPPDVDKPPPPTVERLPTGYSVNASGLSYQGQLIWPTQSTSNAFVGRVGDLSVINDNNQGLRVVDDAGTVLVAPPLGQPEYDAVRVLVDGETAFTVTADGRLYAINGAAHA